MTNLKFKNCKNNLSKWVLATLFIISSFAFSGYNNNALLQSGSKAKTEIVNTNSNKASRHTTCYSRLFLSLNNFCKPGVCILLQHNRLVKTKYNFISKRFKSISVAVRLIPVKKIPQNAADKTLTFITV